MNNLCNCSHTHNTHTHRDIMAEVLDVVSKSVGLNFTHVHFRIWEKDEPLYHPPSHRLIVSLLLFYKDYFGVI